MVMVVPGKDGRDSAGDVASPLLARPRKKGKSQPVWEERSRREDVSQEVGKVTTCVEERRQSVACIVYNIPTAS